MGQLRAERPSEGERPENLLQTAKAREEHWHNRGRSQGGQMLMALGAPVEDPWVDGEDEGGQTALLEQVGFELVIPEVSQLYNPKH